MVLQLSLVTVSLMHCQKWCQNFNYAHVWFVLTPKSFTEATLLVTKTVELWMSQMRQPNNECPASYKFAFLLPTGCGWKDLQETSSSGTEAGGVQRLPSSLVQGPGIHCNDVRTSWMGRAGLLLARVCPATLMSGSFYLRQADKLATAPSPDHRRKLRLRTSQAGWKGKLLSVFDRHMTPTHKWEQSNVDMLRSPCISFLHTSPSSILPSSSDLHKKKRGKNTAKWWQHLPDMESFSRLWLNSDI